MNELNTTPFLAVSHKPMVITYCGRIECELDAALLFSLVKGYFRTLHNGEIHYSRYPNTPFSMSQ